MPASLAHRRLACLLAALLLLSACRPAAAPLPSPVSTPLPPTVQPYPSPGSPRSTPSSAVPKPLNLDTLSLSALRDLPEMAEALAFSPDGRWLAATQTAFGQVVVWNISSGPPSLDGPDLTFPSRQNGTLCLSLAFSPDSRRLATCGENDELWLYDLASGERVLSLSGSAGLDKFAFSPTGEFLVSASAYEKALRVWDLSNGKTLHLLEQNTTSLAAAYTPDGRYVASIEYGPQSSVLLWDANTGELSRRLEGLGGYPQAIAFHPHLPVVASADYQGKLALWDIETGQRLQTLLENCGSTSALAFSPDGRMLFTANDDGEPNRVFAALEEGAGKEKPALLLLSEPPHFSRLALHPDGRGVALAGPLAIPLEGQGIVRLANLIDEPFVAAGRIFPVTPMPTPWPLPEPARNLRARYGLGDLYAMAVSPTGEHVAAGGSAGLHVFQVEDLRKLWYSEGNGSVFDLAFSPDGQQLASGDYSGVITLFEASTGVITRYLEGHTDAVRGVAFAPGGSQLVSASMDGSVRVWDLGSGGEPSVSLQLSASNTFFYRALFSPDSRYIAAGGSTGKVYVWDAQTGDLAITLADAGDLVTQLAFSPDGKYLAGGGMGLAIWEFPTGVRLPGPDTGAFEITALAFASESQFTVGGPRLAWGTETGQVSLWDVEQTMQDGEWNVQPGGMGTSINGLAFTRGGELWAALRSGSTALVSVDTQDWQVQASLPNLSPYLFEAAFNGDQAWLATSDRTNRIDIWRLSSEDRLELHSSLVLDVTPGCEPVVSAIALSPGGALLGASYQACGDSFVMWEVETGERLYYLPADWFLLSLLEFSLDGRYFAGATSDGSVMVWETATGERKMVQRVEDGWPRSLAFSPDGETLAVGGSSAHTGQGVIHRWEVSTGEQLPDLHGHRVGVIALAYSPGGDRMASGSEDSTFILWDLATGVQASERMLAGPVSSLAYSADGSLLAVGSSRMIVVWETGDLQPLSTLVGHNGWVQDLFFFPGGEALISASWDSTLAVWDLSP